MSIESKHAYRFGFLKSEKWENLRVACLVKNKGRCVVCGVRDLSNDAHHVRYPRSFWDTKVVHLKTVCRVCHTAIHDLQKEFGQLPNMKDWPIRCPSVWPSNQCRICGYDDGIITVLLRCRISYFKKKVPLCATHRWIIFTALCKRSVVPGLISDLTKFQAPEIRRLTALTLWRIELARQSSPS
jgi:hypothetical protein